MMKKLLFCTLIFFVHNKAMDNPIEDSNRLFQSWAQLPLNEYKKAIKSHFAKEIAQEFHGPLVNSLMDNEIYTFNSKINFLVHKMKVNLNCPADASQDCSLLDSVVLQSMRKPVAEQVFALIVNGADANYSAPKAKMPVYVLMAFLQQMYTDNLRDKELENINRACAALKTSPGITPLDSESADQLCKDFVRDDVKEWGLKLINQYSGRRFTLVGNILTDLFTPDI